MSQENTEKNTKIFIFISLAITVLLLVGVVFLLGSGKSTDSKPITAGDLVENGKQIIQINAKNGYSPSTILAKSGTPSILRFNTKDTFDCSTALVIRQLGITKSLPSNGSTDIEVPAQASGNVLRGSCDMGMYSFSIKFN